MKLLILADDLTGALDTAVYFAECGASVLIRTAAESEQTVGDETPAVDLYLNQE